MIIDAFKDKIFVLYREGRFEGKDEDEDEIKDENGLINYQMLVLLIIKCVIGSVF